MSTVVTSSVEREFEQLFREHYRLLYRTAYSLLGSPADAEDVLQTVFESYEPDGGPYYTVERVAE